MIVLLVGGPADNRAWPWTEDDGRDIRVRIKRCEPLRSYRAGPIAYPPAVVDEIHLYCKYPDKNEAHWVKMESTTE